MKREYQNVRRYYIVKYGQKVGEEHFRKYMLKKEKKTKLIHGFKITSFHKKNILLLNNGTKHLQTRNN